MAEMPLHSCSGLLGLRFSHVLLAFWCTFLGTGSALTVILTPSFVNGSTGEEVSFTCFVDDKDYHLYWYRQLPGKSELEVLGIFYSYSKALEEIAPELKGRLKGEGSNSKDQPGRKMSLELSTLQANDTGLYLCAAVSRDLIQPQAYFAPTGTQLLVTDPNCASNPRVVLLEPLCHRKRITLVCLAQGFNYKWPLDVIWMRNGEKVDRLSSATQPFQKDGECNFATASRLSVSTTEWHKGHEYSCHVNQGETMLNDSVKSTPKEETESTSGISEVQLSLYAGQCIFLLLGAKSLAYSAILGIYKFYRKKGL